MMRPFLPDDFGPLVIEGIAISPAMQAAGRNAYDFLMMYEGDSPRAAINAAFAAMAKVRDIEASGGTPSRSLLGVGDCEVLAGDADRQKGALNGKRLAQALGRLEAFARSRSDH